MFGAWLRPAGYRVSVGARLCRRQPAAAAVLALVASHFGLLGGCSLSYQLDSMSSRARDARNSATIEQTGSVRAPETQPPAVARRGAASGSPVPSAASPATEGDIAATRLALNEALATTSKDFSVPWENPSTGARGTITPLSASRSNNGATCRDFLASYVRNGSEFLDAGRGVPRPAGPLGSAPHETLATHLSGAAAARTDVRCDAPP